MKTHIVIPIGVSVPGTPVQKHLETSVNSILSQTSQDYILTVAADINIPDSARLFLEEKGIEIKWFEPHTWFKKGSIWTKLFDAWEEKESDNIAFLHYDDVWDREKLAIQHEIMEFQGLKGSYSEAYIIDDAGNIKPTDYSFPALSKDTVGMRTMAMAHSIISNKEAFLSSGILDYRDQWAGNYEDMYCLFFHKLRDVAKAPGAKFYWRDHGMNQTSTHSESAQYVLEQRAATGYSLSETMDDVEKIQFNQLVNNVKKIY
jgi:hypothetical protein